MYLLLVGDLPEVVHDQHHDQSPQHEEDSDQDRQCDYNLHCRDCGGVTAFVDDSTYQASAATPEELSDKLQKAS